MYSSAKDKSRGKLHNILVSNHCTNTLHQNHYHNCYGIRLVIIKQTSEQYIREVTTHEITWICIREHECRSNVIERRNKRCRPWPLGWLNVSPRQSQTGSRLFGVGVQVKQQVEPSRITFHQTSGNTVFPGGSVMFKGWNNICIK